MTIAKQVVMHKTIGTFPVINIIKRLDNTYMHLIQFQSRILDQDTTGQAATELDVQKMPMINAGPSET